MFSTNHASGARLWFTRCGVVELGVPYQASQAHSALSTEHITGYSVPPSSTREPTKIQIREGGGTSTAGAAVAVEGRETRRRGRRGGGARREHPSCREQAQAFRRRQSALCSHQAAQWDGRAGEVVAIGKLSQRSITSAHHPARMRGREREQEERERNKE